MNINRENPSLVRIGQEYRSLDMKTWKKWISLRLCVAVNSIRRTEVFM